jgi:hypothetical protein
MPVGSMNLGTKECWWGWALKLENEGLKEHAFGVWHRRISLVCLARYF